MNLVKEPRLRAQELAGWGAWPLVQPWLSRRTGQDRGLVLMFHHIGEPILPGAADFLFIRRDAFESILDFITSHLHPLPPLEFLLRMQAGDLPPRATLLTFDDGTVDNVNIALPALIDRGLSACFFVSPGLIEAQRTVPGLELGTILVKTQPGHYQIELQEFEVEEGGSIPIEIGPIPTRVAAFQRLLPMLIRCPSWRQTSFLRALASDLGISGDDTSPYRLANWTELSQLAAAGMLVASHTQWHSTLAADGLDAFAQDLDQSFQIIDSHFPNPLRILGFPYGRAVDSPPQVVPLLADLGVDFSFVVQGGIADLGQQGRYHLRRHPASYSPALLKSAIARALSGKGYA